MKLEKIHPVFVKIFEWLPKLYDEVQKIMVEQNDTDVQYLYHEIWAMEKLEYNPKAKELVEFSPYNYDSDVMYQTVSETSKKATERYDMRLIPTGDSFQNARSIASFDVSQGGKLLVSDSTNHAGDYGKYLAGITWFETITQKQIDKATVYYSEALSESEANELVDCATQAVEDSGLQFQKAVTEGNVVTDYEEDEEEIKTNHSLPILIGGIVLAVAIVVVVAVIIMKRKRSGK